MNIIKLILSALFIPFLFWLGGFDFNERGTTAALCAIGTIGFLVSAVFVITESRYASTK